MSRPRFLADNDLNDAIVLGVLRREAAIEFRRLRDLALESLDDNAILQYAAREDWIVVSHPIRLLRRRPQDPRAPSNSSPTASASSHSKSGRAGSCD